MKSTQLLAYAALVVAGVDGKPCNRKPSSTVSAGAITTSYVAAAYNGTTSAAATSYHNNTASYVASSYSTSSAYLNTTSSSESDPITTSSFASSTQSVSITSSFVSTSIPVPSVTVSDITSSPVALSTSSFESSASVSVSTPTTSSIALSTTSSDPPTSSSSFITSSAVATSSLESPSVITIVTPPAITLPPVTTSSATLSSSTSSAAPATQTIDVSSWEWTQAILLVHNIHRANHTASNLVWDVSLSMSAAELVTTCEYRHDVSINGSGYGQVIGVGYTGAQITRMINDMYYQGLANYPQPYGVSSPDLSNFASWGNFAQIVWAASARVGCAVQYCPGGITNAPGISNPYFTACNYGPAGVVFGQFGENVHEPVGAAGVVFLP